MTELEKQIVKEVLHLIVDKAAPALIEEQLAKLPVQYQGVAMALEGALKAAVLPVADKAIDGI